MEEKNSDSEVECEMELSDVEDDYMLKHDDEEKMCWLGDEVEKKMEMYHPEQDMGAEHNDRPLFNPASLVRGLTLQNLSLEKNRSLSQKAYATDDVKRPNTHFWTPQLKPKAMENEGMQLIYCLSSIMQTQIRDDEESSHNFALFPQFDVPFSSLSTKLGGDFEVINDVPDSLLDREDESTMPYIMNGTVPVFFSVFRFMIHLHEKIKYDRECNIMALVYLNRITTANNMALTVHNWRFLWLLAVMIAQKVWARKPVRSKGFCKEFSDLRRSTLKRAEMSMMTMLQYNTGVPPSLYAKYYLELNELFACLMETMQVGDGNEVWNWEPVSDFTKLLLKRKFIKSEEDRENFNSGKKMRK